MNQPADTPLSRARRSLDDAVTLVRNREADAQDTVVDMADAERQRLTLLLDELDDVRESLAAKGEVAERFDLAVSQGARPRLWIDVAAWVQMGNDRRTYRFLQETARGRALLAETGDLDLMSERVTRYIAERLVERERRIETEYVATDVTVDPPAPRKRRGGFWRGVLGFVVSFALTAVTVAAVLAALLFAFPDLVP